MKNLKKGDYIIFAESLIEKFFRYIDDDTLEYLSIGGDILEPDEEFIREYQFSPIINHIFKQYFNET